MFATMVRQLRYGARMIRGAALHPPDMRALAADLRATIEEFGDPGDEASALLPGSAEPDKDIQRDMARRRLRLTVAHAAEHVPYYRRWFAENDVDPRGITAESFGSVPLTSKAELRAAPAAFVSARAEPVLLAQTTGTTGMPTSVCALVMIGAGFLAAGTICPSIVVDRLATPMHLPGKDPQISHLITTASYLGSLVQHVERDGWRTEDFGLRQILVGGEVLSDPLRQRAERAFGAQVTDTYSMTETMPMAGLCCEQGHLHLASEQSYVEILDPLTGEPTRPGDVGSLVVTPYSQYRDTTLLLRYLTGDLVRRLPSEQDLACSLRAMPATSRILGRRSQAHPELTTRAILDVLQAEWEIPLPTRFAVTGDAVLHVAVDHPTQGLLSRIQDRAADLPIAGVVLAEGQDGLPEPCKVRADLTENSFEMAEAARQLAGSLR